LNYVLTDKGLNMNIRAFSIVIIGLLLFSSFTFADNHQLRLASGNFLLEQRLNSIHQFQQKHNLGANALADKWYEVKKEIVDINVESETGLLFGTSEFQVIGDSDTLYSFISGAAIISWTVTINGVPITVEPIEYPYYKNYWYIYFELPPRTDIYEPQIVQMQYTMQHPTSNSEMFSYLSTTNGFCSDQFIPSLYDDVATRPIDMTISLNSDLDLVVGGRITSQEETPDGHTTYTIDPYMAGNRTDMFIYGNFNLIQVDAGEYGQVEMYLDEELDGFNKYAEFAAYALENYAIRFRMASPFQPLRFAHVKSGMFGGLSSAGLILLNLDAYFSNGEDELAVEEVIAHEMAHQFWGNYSVAYGSDVWLTEGMAEYQSFRLMGERHGQSVEEDFFNNARDTYLYYSSYSSDVPLSTAYIDVYEQSDAFAIVYEKGACIHKMLEETIGKDKYDLIAQSMLAYRGLGEYRYIRDFWQYTDIIMDDDYSWFFENWIYKAYYPRIYLDWSVMREGEDDNHIRVYLDQWTPNYELPITVAFISNRRDTFKVEKWLTPELSQEWDCNVPFIPSQVILDPAQTWILEQWQYDRTAEIDQQDNLPRNSLQISANPFWDYLTIEFNQDNQSPSINKIFIYDLQGKLIEKLIVSSKLTKLTWDASTVPAGMYYIMTDNASIGKVKVVKIQ
jgi:hypothetical protein